MSSTRAIAISPELVELNRLKVRARRLMLVCLLMLVYATAGLIVAQIRYPDLIKQIACFQLNRSGAIPSSRGRILDCKNIPLVDNRIVSSLFVNPSLVDDSGREELAALLSGNFHRDIYDMRETLSRTSSTRQILVDEMTGSELEQLGRLKKGRHTGRLMKEVGVMARETRYYPTGPVASPLLGFTTSRDEGQVGLWGIEEQYDDVLTGRPGEYSDVRDQRGRRVPFSRQEITTPRYGTDLVLTLDSEIQALAESALSAGLLETNAIGGAIVVTEPSTGNVLALASLPTFDPANTADFDSAKEKYFSRSTALSYEAGSVMKIFTVAGGLEEKVINSESFLHVTQHPLRFGKHVVPDHVYPKIDDMNIRQVVVDSCNRGAAIVATLLGHKRLQGWLHKFGFGSQTPLVLPGEPGGNLKESMNPFPEIDLANMGFGQGITVSPLQLAQALGVFANGGTLVPIRLVKARRDPSCNELVNMSPSEPVPVLSPEIAKTMQDFMTGVVEEGTATAARNGWVCAGKTGTAQKVVGGQYCDGQFYATFTGYGPIPNPKWVIVVILDEPHPIHFGGAACGPIYKRLFEALMIREGIPPERNADGSPKIAVPVQTAAVTTQPTGDDSQDDLVTNAKGYVISSDPFDSGSSQG